MNDNVLTAYRKIGRYSFWTGVTGIVCYMTFFPSGIYYCFFCGVMAAAMALVARKNVSGARFAAGAVLGIIDIGLSLIAYYALYVIYSAVQDPVAGPQVTELIRGMFAQYGMSLDMFTSLMR